MPRKPASRPRRRYVRNTDGKRSLTYRATVDDTIRTIHPDRLVEHDGGDVEAWFDDRTFSFRVHAKNVIAVDGVKRTRGDASALFSRTVPMPKSRDRDKRELEFYFACKSSRTLREAVVEARDECAREGGTCNFTRGDWRFDFGVVYDAKGKPTARDRSEFTGGIRWDDKDRKAVARKVFDALVAWNVLDEPYKSGKETHAEGRRRIIIGRDTFVTIARDIFETTGTGLRTLDYTAWAWFGMDSDDVEHHFFEAHQYRLLEYYRSGSVVSLKFLDREAAKNPPRRGRRAR